MAKGVPQGTGPTSGTHIVLLRFSHGGQAAVSDDFGSSPSARRTAKTEARDRRPRRRGRGHSVLGWRTAGVSAKAEARERQHRRKDPKEPIALLMAVPFAMANSVQWGRARLPIQTSLMLRFSHGALAAASEGFGQSPSARQKAYVSTKTEAPDRPGKAEAATRERLEDVGDEVFILPKDPVLVGAESRWNPTLPPSDFRDRDH